MDGLEQGTNEGLNTTATTADSQTQLGTQEAAVQTQANVVQQQAPQTQAQETYSLSKEEYEAYQQYKQSQTPATPEKEIENLKQELSRINEERALQQEILGVQRSIEWCKSIDPTFDFETSVSLFQEMLKTNPNLTQIYGDTPAGMLQFYVREVKNNPNIQSIISANNPEIERIIKKLDSGENLSYEEQETLRQFSERK